MDGKTGEAAAEGPTGRPHGRPNVALVFLVLGGVTLIEVLLSQLAGIPRVPVLLTLSLFKALLVVLYYMHLRYDSPWFALVFGVPFLLVITLMLVVPQ
jgi:caa(3)-type oxidase subunit IV